MRSENIIVVSFIQQFWMDVIWKLYFDIVYSLTSNAMSLFTKYKTDIVAIFLWFLFKRTVFCKIYPPQISKSFCASGISVSIASWFVYWWLRLGLSQFTGKSNFKWRTAQRRTTISPLLLKWRTCSSVLITRLKLITIVDIRY